MSSAAGSPGLALDPPSDVDAERGLLGALMIGGPAQFTRILLDQPVSAEDFHRRGHALIFSAMSALHDAGESIDRVTVADQLQRMGALADAGGAEQLDEIVATIPRFESAPRYAQSVRDCAVGRRIQRYAVQVLETVAERRHDADELVSEVERLLLAQRPHHANPTLAIAEALSRTIERLEQVRDHGGAPGVRTGFGELDAVTGGFHAGNLIIVGARPAMGKSAFVQIVSGFVAITLRQPVLFVSPEMTADELVQRYLAQRGLINTRHLLHASLNDSDWASIRRVRDETVDVPLHLVDEAGITVSEIRARARDLALRVGPLGMIVVDYLQLMAPEGARHNSTRTIDVGEMSRGLKVLAREMNCPVVAVSQLNRAVEHRPDPTPTLADLRESGNLEQDGDVILFLVRPSYYDPAKRVGELDLIIGKSRMGGTDERKIVLQWQGEYTIARDRALEDD